MRPLLSRHVEGGGPAEFIRYVNPGEEPVVERENLDDALLEVGCEGLVGKKLGRRGAEQDVVLPEPAARQLEKTFVDV